MERAAGEAASVAVAPARVRRAHLAPEATSLWLYHTPAGVVTGLPDGAPAVAAERVGSSRPTPTLHRQYG